MTFIPNLNLLKGLETISENDDLPEILAIPQAENRTEELSADEDLKPEEDFMENAEVRLRDLIDKFWADSVRPVIIICDDKVKYVNQVVRDMLNVSDDAIVGHNFLDFVKRDDWNLLAENIGVMLTDAKKVSIHLQTSDNQVMEVVLEAMYIPDDNHFAFVLIGNQMRKETEPHQMGGANMVSLYDQVTGLPSFYLFEDRVRVAVNQEAYKDVPAQKNMMQQNYHTLFMSMNWNMIINSLNYMLTVNMSDYRMGKWVTAK